jgi:hypothetical protein
MKKQGFVFALLDRTGQVIKTDGPIKGKYYVKVNVGDQFKIRIENTNPVDYFCELYLDNFKVRTATKSNPYRDQGEKYQARRSMTYSNWSGQNNGLLTFSRFFPPFEDLIGEPHELYVVSLVIFKPKDSKILETLKIHYLTSGQAPKQVRTFI